MKKLILFIITIIMLTSCNESTQKFDTAIDLEMKKIGVGIGSGADIILSEDMNNKIYRYELVTEAAFALAANKLHAIAAEETTVHNMIKINPDFKALPEIIGYENYAMVVSDKSPISVDELNKYIDEFILTEKYYDMMQKWIGSDLTNVTLDNVENNSKDELVVGINSEYVPFEYFGDNGKRQGFAVEFAEYMGKAFGVKIVYFESAFTSLFPALKSGKIDVIISSVAITKERAQNYTMTHPYFSNKIIFMVKK